MAEALFVKDHSRRHRRRKKITEWQHRVVSSLGQAEKRSGIASTARRMADSDMPLDWQ